MSVHSSVSNDIRNNSNDDLTISMSNESVLDSESSESFLDMEGLESFDDYRIPKIEENEFNVSKQNDPVDAYTLEYPDEAQEGFIGNDEKPRNIESVIGRDDRRRVKPTKRSPWNKICLLKLRTKDGLNAIGTGWFAGPRTVITAGHVVYSHRHGGWMDKIEVIPGNNGTDKPFGSVISRSFYTVRGWIGDRNRNYDYGAIILPKSTSIGQKTGWFAASVLSDEKLKNKFVNLCGYPGDRPRVNEKPRAPKGTRQYYMARKLTDLTPHLIKYDIDTYGGQSGSPVWRKIGGKRSVVGIHTGVGIRDVSNRATRINQGVFNNISKWIKESNSLK